MGFFSSQSPLAFTSFEWTDPSKEESVKTLSYSAEEIGIGIEIQPTFQSSVLRITSTKTEETEDNSGTTEAATQRPRDERSTRSTISIELTSLTDIMQTESLIKTDPESETTHSYHTTTQQGQHIGQNSSTPTHADFAFDSRQQSRYTDELVTLSSMSDVTSKQSSNTITNTITSIDSTSKAHDPTSGDYNRMSTAAVAVDGVRSFADHSQSRLNDTSSAGVTFSLDSTAAYTGATAHASSETDNRTSSAQVPSDDDAVSTQYNKHAFTSTSTLDAKFSEHTVSTDAQEDPVIIGTSSQYAWKTSEAGNTFQSGSATSAERLSPSSENPPESEGPGTSAVTGYAIGAAITGVVLIVILCVVVIIYRRRRRKSCDLADQDLKDYRSLMKMPSRIQTTDGFTTPYGAHPYSPFVEFTADDGSDSPFSATNFRARFDHEPNGTSTQNNGFESEKEIPLQELCEPSSAAGYSEAFSVDTFRPNRQNTADTQSEATNVV